MTATAIPTTVVSDYPLSINGPRISAKRAADYVRRFCFEEGVEIQAEHAQKRLFDAYYGFKLRGPANLIDELHQHLAYLNGRV